MSVPSAAESSVPAARWDAFISYRRKDGRAAARWLRRRLLRYRMPRRLEAYDRPLRIFQDVAYERATTDFYDSTIRPALSDARVLIVLCTKGARDRLEGGALNFPEREVNDFCAKDGPKTIVPALVDGEFGDALPGDLDSAYPNLQIVDLRPLRGVRRCWFRNWGKLDDQLIKIVGSLFDVPHRGDARPTPRRSTS